MTVQRLLSTGNVRIWGPVGTIYHPELITELTQDSLTTEQDEIILLG